ncbi:MAG TPA: hypothetical protein VF173_36175 [Thermoanaerobaculia bacterium]|nr:hypothetical protein [Thermoanaerobaculia bacterium]
MAWADIVSLVGVIASVVGVLFAALAVFSATRRGSIKINGARGFEAEVSAERDKLPPPTGGGSITERQYLLLREYHAQGLAQSKISFWFSLVFAALGFLVVITAIFAIDPKVQITEQGRAIITLISGTVIDTVSALFFVQSNKARQLMVDFFDRLRSDRKLEESLTLASSLENAELKGRLYALLSLSFADIKSNEAFLASLMGIANSGEGGGSQKFTAQATVNPRSPNTEPQADD